MAINIQFEIEGVKELSRRIIGIAKDTNDFSKEFKQSGDFLKLFSETKVFDSEGSILRKKWASGPNYNKLQRTGRMRRGFKSRSKKMSTTVSNVVDYFKYHQSRLPRRRLPRRIMLRLTEQIRQRIVKFFSDGLNKRVNKKR